MWHPIPLFDLELTRAIPKLPRQVAHAREVRVLLRLQGTPVGSIGLPVVGDDLETEGLVERILDSHFDTISRWALSDVLLAGKPPATQWLLTQAPPRTEANRVSVIVCTRQRPDDLRRCLAALRATEPTPLEIIVVDNAPLDAATQQVAAEFPGVCYCLEPRPGLDWARNRGLLAARGDIVAFVDDDVVVDRAWAGMLQHVFDSSPGAAAVTGLIHPYELDTPAQAHFELCGGFGRGFAPRWEHYPSGQPLPWRMLGTGVLGSGANMAFRREIFQRIGLFLPELDTGTPTGGGGDLEILFRVLKHGHPVVYDPRVLCRHRHRREAAELEHQLATWGVATFAMLECIRLHYPDEARNALRYGLYWKRRLAQRVVGQYLRPNRIPSEVRWRELKGALSGRQRYHEALRRAREIELEFGPQPGAAAVGAPPREPPAASKLDRQQLAVRTVDLTEGAQGIDDVGDYWTTRVFLSVFGRTIAHVDVHNQGLPISRERLVQRMLQDKSAVEWVALAQNVSSESARASFRTRLAEGMLPLRRPTSSVRVTQNCRPSVVLATCDRPVQLRRALNSLAKVRQRTAFELVVVDNRPDAPGTAEVVRAFPDVVYVPEARRGLSYARNAGFIRARGDIIVCTDDDVVFPEDWLDTLLAPFQRNDIDIVCGNVLPLSLEAESQVRFESYGGLGKGYAAFEADQDWFYKSWLHAVETWNLGATANAAFRTSLLRDPDVGLFEEALGPGVPAGVGEDTYFFYKALLSGYKLRYEPNAIVWHEHRRTHAELRRQLFDYSRGHVAYHLHTLRQHGDFRALLRIGHVLSWQVSRVGRHVLRSSSDGYPLGLVLTELRGNLAGPASLWQSYRVVKRVGASAPMPAAAAPLPPAHTEPDEPVCSKTG